MQKKNNNNSNNKKEERERERERDKERERESERWSVPEHEQDALYELRLRYLGCEPHLDTPHAAVRGYYGDGLDEGSRLSLVWPASVASAPEEREVEREREREGETEKETPWF